MQPDGLKNHVYGQTSSAVAVKKSRLWSDFKRGGRLELQPDGLKNHVYGQNSSAVAV